MSAGRPAGTSLPRGQPPIVFLGPSLSVREARGILPAADYRPPLRRGDLDAIDRPASVLVIDGLLAPDQRLPVSEARAALRRGLELHGASSTGALLALELADHGMRGSGRVFEFLRDFPGQRENLVALLHAGPQFHPLTVPLINVVLGHGDEHPGREALDALAGCLAGIPLHERSWETIETVMREAGFSIPPSIRFADAKGEDARTLLASIRESRQPRP
ncbi:MAG: TfuA-like protein [Burkholderiaceae bacterium]